jgi:hypothetical protein
MSAEPMTAHETITYYVNGESQHTSERKLSVRVILSTAGFNPPEQYRLERDDGHHIYGSLDEEVSLHQGERFTALFQGPTPTSGV